MTVVPTAIIPFQRHIRRIVIITKQTTERFNPGFFLIFQSHKGSDIQINCAVCARIGPIEVDPNTAKIMLFGQADAGLLFGQLGQRLTARWEIRWE
ncbi:hypothetical protein D3C80_1776880 [compost metagenome]